jgi:YVTN family beta-propeller protein
MKNLHRLLMCSCFALALMPMSASAETDLVYITNSAGDSVHIIDPKTNKVVQPIKNVEGAHGVNFSPDGSRVYISSEMSETLDAYDRKTGALIKKVKLSNHPNNIAVDKKGRILVGIARGDGAVDIIDPEKLEVAKTIPVKGRVHNIYTTPDGKFLVVGSVANSYFTVIDLQKDQIAWEYDYDLGVRPMTIETNPDGSTKRVFIQISELDGFSVLDFAQRKEVQRIKFQNLKSGVDVDAGREDAPAHGLGVSPDGKTLWATSIPQNAVFIYDLSGPQVKEIGHVNLPTVEIPGKPLGGAVANWVTFSNDGQIYISNSGLRSVTAIDMKTRKINAVIPVGEVPKRIGTLVLK